MAAGKVSPVVQAIEEAERSTTGEIRVHLSRRLIERDPMARAMKLFHDFELFRTTQRNAVLLYVNLRRRKVAIYGDEAVHKAVGQNYWEGTIRELIRDLRSTHSEKALAATVLRIGKALEKHFPVNAGVKNLDELPNIVTKD